MQKPRMILFAAGLTEVIWATAMDYSDGFAIWYYDIIVLVFLAVSTVLLGKALKGGIPVGTGYAVWTGIGAVGTIALSVAAGHETLTLLRSLFVMMIIAGISGLQLTAGGPGEDEKERSE